MAGSKKGKWRDRTIEKLNRAQAPTVFLGDEELQSGIASEDQPQFDVFQVKLRGKEDEPIVISGNVLNIELQVSLLKAVDQLLEIRGFGSGTSGGKTSDISTLSNRPYIQLYFKQTKNIEKGQRATEMKLTFNIMDKTDLTIDKSDLKEFARRIKEEFYTGDKPYTHTKGKSRYTYHDWANGYHLGILAKNETDATALLNKILKIKDDKLNEKFWKESKAVHEDKAYPKEPPKINILDKEYTEPIRRPIADVDFLWAKIHLPTIHKEIVLVSLSRVLPISSDI